MSLSAIMIPLLVTVAPPKAKQPAMRLVGSKALQPTVVGKGQGFVVHGIPLDSDRGWVAGLGRHDFVIAHTALPAGKMTVLDRSGEIRTFSPPMGIDKVSFRKTEFLGVAVKHGHIAILSRIYLAGGIRTGKTPRFGSYTRPAYYQLALFDARSGKRRSTLAIDRKRAEEAARLIMIGAGPLKIEKDRILLWKQTVQIDAKGKLRFSRDGEK